MFFFVFWGWSGGYVHCSYCKTDSSDNQHHDQFSLRRDVIPVILPSLFITSYAALFCTCCNQVIWSAGKPVKLSYNTQGEI